jgi:hypothetical protein
MDTNEKDELCKKIIKEIESIFTKYGDKLNSHDILGILEISKFSLMRKVNKVADMNERKSMMSKLFGGDL